MTLTIVGISLALLVCMTGVVIGVMGRRNSGPQAQEDCVRLEDPAKRVLWDIAEGGNAPVVKDGVVYLDRRSFGSRIAAAATALLGIFVTNKAQILVPPSEALPTKATGSGASEGNRGRYSNRNFDDAHNDHSDTSPTLE